MRMSKHTPGPWNVFITPSGHQYIEHWVNGKRTSGKVLIAQVVSLTPDKDEEALAAKPNARLIAAAPELLIKVRQLATLLKNIHCEGGLPGFSLDDLEADTLAILAKAEGREP